MIRLVKTQYNIIIKRFRMDGRKEYAPTQIDELIVDLGTIIKLLTLFYAY